MVAIVRPSLTDFTSFAVTEKSTAVGGFSSEDAILKNVFQSFERFSLEMKDSQNKLCKIRGRDSDVRNVYPITTKELRCTTVNSTLDCENFRTWANRTRRTRQSARAWCNIDSCHVRMVLFGAPAASFSCSYYTSGTSKEQSIWKDWTFNEGRVRASLAALSDLASGTIPMEIWLLPRQVPRRKAVWRTVHLMPILKSSTKPRGSGLSCTERW